MFEGLSSSNRELYLTAPVGGLNLVDSIAAMPERDALMAENVICYPDRVEMRAGTEDHSTGYANPVEGLWAYNGLTATTLWATTDAGIYNATAAGAVGAAAIALTNGRTMATILNTGAGTFLSVVNGTDTLRQYDGTTWSSIAAFGGLNTANISAIETYKQRMYLIEKNTMTLWYLAVNSVSGAATSYPLGAIFRRGGTLRSLATWTVDGGAGPDDHLAICTSAGEVAIFTGTDPSSAATWALRGVYYIGRPVGTLCLYKYGGELLYLSESGLFPLSRALQTASIDRTSSVSSKIRQLFVDYHASYGATDGWQMINHPDVPVLLVNVPGTTTGTQLVMHSQTGAWSTFTGWSANCWERVGNQLYFGGSTKVSKALVGAADYGANIVSTCFSAFSRLRYPRNKQIKMVRPIFRSNGAFQFTLGVANDFSMTPTSTVVPGSAGSSLWGTGVWGTAVWSSSDVLTREWRVVPDVNGTYKALYWQIASKAAQAAHLSTDVLYSPGGTF